MEYLIYISTAKRLLNDHELTEILNVSRTNNEKNNITGVLLYNEGTFIQFLEGPSDALNATYEAILNDEQHKNVIKLITAPITTRNFSDWTMGFRSVNSLQLEMIPGYFNPDLKTFENDGQHPGLTIIKTFVENS